MSSTVPRRKIVMAAAVAGIDALPRASFAQAKQRMYRIGMLSLDLDPKGFARDEFFAELSRRGYTEGVNIVVLRRTAAMGRGGEMDRLALEIAQAGVDVIYAEGGTAAALAAKKTTSVIPIVFFSSGDPVGLGLVTDLAHPGGNLTGASLQGSEITAKGTELLARIIGKLRNMVYLQAESVRLGPSYPLLAAGARAGAKAVGARIEFVDYEPIDELEPKLQRLVEAGVDGAGAFVPSVPEGRTLAELLIKLRLPSVGPPQAGFLVGCNASLPEAARIAAKHIDQILKGAKPKDLPIEIVSTFFVGINLRTAKALGLSIPSSVLLQATTLIE